MPDLCVRSGGCGMTRDRFPDDRYLTAIARRNVTWARWKDAEALLAIARDEIGFADLRPYVRNVNDAGRDYEQARTDLIRARVHRKAERAGTPQLERDAA